MYAPLWRENSRIFTRGCGGNLYNPTPTSVYDAKEAPKKFLLTIVRGLARHRTILVGISGAILLGVVEPGAATV